MSTPSDVRHRKDSIVHAFISSRFDYCNSLLHGVSDAEETTSRPECSCSGRVGSQKVCPHHAGTSSSSLASSPPENQVQAAWLCGVAVECRTCGQEVVGSSLSRALLYR